MAAEVVLGGGPHACVSDDVIQHHEPLKLQLELTIGVFRQRLGLKLAQIEIGVLVSIDKELEGADLVGESESSASCWGKNNLCVLRMFPAGGCCTVMQCSPHSETALQKAPVL